MPSFSITNTAASTAVIRVIVVISGVVGLERERMLRPVSRFHNVKEWHNSYSILESNQPITRPKTFD
jgi:hypothetical protein